MEDVSPSADYIVLLNDRIEDMEKTLQSLKDERDASIRKMYFSGSDMVSSKGDVIVYEERTRRRINEDVFISLYPWVVDKIRQDELKDYVPKITMTNARKYLGEEDIEKACDTGQSEHISIKKAKR